MAESFIPRVNFEVMQRYQGRKVCLVGQIKGFADGSYIIGTSDDAEVKVQPEGSNPAGWGEADFVEVIGRVVDPRIVQAESHVNLKGPPVDMKLYNETVKLMNNKYTQLFAA